MTHSSSQTGGDPGPCGGDEPTVEHSTGCRGQRLHLKIILNTRVGNKLALLLSQRELALVPTPTCIFPTPSTGAVPGSFDAFVLGGLPAPAQIFSPRRATITVRGEDHVSISVSQYDFHAEFSSCVHWQATFKRVKGR